MTTSWIRRIATTLSPGSLMVAAMTAAVVAAALRPQPQPLPIPEVAPEGVQTTQPAPTTAEASVPEAAPPSNAAAEVGTASTLPIASDVAIEVNIPATEMTLYEGGNPLFRRKVAIGQGVYPTPEQESLLKRIEWNPWWYPPPDAAWAKGAKPTPPGPGNPLGLVKMPLSDAIMFHGTNKDWSVGFAASHGCMRMHNRDVTALAWYLQEKFSAKCDPELLEQYRKNRGTTYRVDLNAGIPVKLFYRPVVARDDVIAFYPDHYRRVAANRKAAVITALVRGGYDLATFDDAAISHIANEWPLNQEIAIPGLLMTKEVEPPAEEECL